MDLSPSSPELYIPGPRQATALECAAQPEPVVSTPETWRGTLPEAIQVAKQSGVTLARPGNPDQALSWDALLATVQRAQAQVCPGDPPRAYALRKDGAVVNTALDRVEYVPVLATSTTPVSLPSDLPSPRAASPVEPTAAQTAVRSELAPPARGAVYAGMTSGVVDGAIDGFKALDGTLGGVVDAVLDGFNPYDAHRAQLGDGLKQLRAAKDQQIADQCFRALDELLPDREWKVGPSGATLVESDLPPQETAMIAVAGVSSVVGSVVVGAPIEAARVLMDPKGAISDTASDVIDANREMVEAFPIMLDSTRPGTERIEALGQVLTAVGADLMVAAPFVQTVRGILPRLVPARVTFARNIRFIEARYAEAANAKTLRAFEDHSGRSIPLVVDERGNLVDLGTDALSDPVLAEKLRSGKYKEFTLYEAVSRRSTPRGVELSSEYEVMDSQPDGRWATAHRQMRKLADWMTSARFGSSPSEPPAPASPPDPPEPRP